MSPAMFVGRVGGLAVALGIGAAVAGGTAISAADSSQDSGSSGPSRTSSAQHSRHSAGSGSVARPAAATQPRASVASRASAAAAAEVAPPAAVVVDTPPAAVVDTPPPAPVVNTPPSAPVTAVAPAAAAVAAPAAAATIAPAPTAAVAPSAAAAPAAADPVESVSVAPDPDATTETPYGDLGKWMLNKDGEIADWVGIPYCTDGTCKKMQEPINVIFTVEAKSKWWAEARLNWKLRQAGFPPSCCSSVGYQAILDEITSQQMPRGGILGVGVLGPGNFQRGLLGLLAGIGPAYRDAFFMTTNSHMRTFGGVSDGNGNWVFTGSVSKEYYTTVDGKPTHGYESFDQARDKLLSDMVAAGNTDLGLVAMHNAIPADDPDYTTGDADGYAQVIGITSMMSMAWRPSVRT